MAVVVVEIRSNDGLGHLDISGWEIEGAEYVPSFRCEVFAEASGFRGKNTVHFDKEDLDGFLAELAVLDRTLTGTATLRSMSPDEFMLTFKPLDRRGHLMVLVTIGKYMYHGLEDFRVTLSYEIDLAVVSCVRSDFAALAAKLG